MGIQKTKLNKTKIKNILKKEYNIEAIKINPINRGTSNIFRIETMKNKYILKEFVSTRTEESIIKEIEIINFLKKRNIKVPEYIQRINNNFYIKNEERIIIVQKFIEGYTIEDNTGDYEKVIECARIFGKLTKELMDYPELSDENIIEKQFSKNKIHLSIERMEKLKRNLKKENKYREKIIKDMDYKIKIAKEIEKEFKFDILKQITMLNSHGDFSIQQLIYKDSEEPTIIDFEKAMKLPIVWEIMRSFSYIDKDIKNNNINIETLVDYFKEVMKYIKLNKYDLEYAAQIYLVQLIGSTYGYEEYNNDFEQVKLLNFAFYRTNLAKLLYENIKNISAKLSELAINP